MKINLYCRNNISKIYLSQYVHILPLEKDKINIYNHISGESISITGTALIAFNSVRNLLLNGAYIEDILTNLETILSKIESQDFVKTLIHRGILE